MRCRKNYICLVLKYTGAPPPWEREREIPARGMSPPVSCAMARLSLRVRSNRSSVIGRGPRVRELVENT